MHHHPKKQIEGYTNGKLNYLYSLLRCSAGKCFSEHFYFFDEVIDKLAEILMHHGSVVIFLLPDQPDLFLIL